MKINWEKGYGWAFFYVLLLALAGFLLGDTGSIAEGLYKIMVSNDLLITDYFVIAGIAATFINVALMTLITILFLYFNKIPMDGNSVMIIGLMSGFAFFGKNIFNFWFMIFGTMAYCKIKKEKFSKYIIASLLSTALGPLISTTFFADFFTLRCVLISIVCGVTIGFVVPVLFEHTGKILCGLNLYNGGFALGLLALILVSLLKSYGFNFEPVRIWHTGDNMRLSIILYSVFFILIIWGIARDPKNSIGNYLNILKRPGNRKEDFIELDGVPAVLINMGVNGIIAVSYILLIRGDLNGPTLGGIFTIVGFGARGKHAKNIIPIMLGVALGGYTKLWSITDPSAQLAALFGTTLAPIAGTYGPIAGIAAGFIHSSLVLYAGVGYYGVNLYNNGFAGGITAIVAHPILSNFVKPNTYSEPSPNMRINFEHADCFGVEVPNNTH